MILYVHDSLKLANIPPEYLTGEIVDEIWDAHLYDKLLPINSGMTVLDIGASIGVFTIYASQKVGPNGRVIAFEPESTSYNALLDNLEANNVNNVTTLNMGVWGSNGTKNIEKARGNLGASTMFHGKGEPVEVVRLDEILRRLGISHVDFVKIDTEGAATEILKGADLQAIDNFAIAAYHIPHEDPLDLGKTLRSAGFRTKVLTRWGITPYLYATRNPYISLEYTELWQYLTVASIAGLVIYEVMK